MLWYKTTLLCPAQLGQFTVFSSLKDIKGLPFRGKYKYKAEHAARFVRVKTGRPVPGGKRSMGFV